MAHFAKLNDENIVVDIIRVNNSDCGDLPFPDSEPIGQAFIASLGIDGKWIQASYSGSFRKRYPFSGVQYDEENEVFIFPQPYPSWSLDENFAWQAPVSPPSDDASWWWNESEQSWNQFLEVSESEEILDKFID